MNSENLRGAAYITVAMAGFAVNDAIMKVVSADMGLYQAIFLRGIVATALISALAWQQGVLKVRPGKRDRFLIGLRSISEVATTVFFLTALFNMPIANATAILQSSPLVITLAASVFLGEAIGWRRILATMIGFAGVLIIVRPGSDGFNIYTLSVLAAVVSITFREIATRQIGKAVPSLLVALATSVLITVFGGVVSGFFLWVEVTAYSLLLLSLSSIFLLAGYIFGVMAMRSGEIGFISPFRYSILIWAILLGIWVFDEIPDTLTLIGSIIVVGMGIFTFYRERQIAGRALPDGKG